MPVFQERQGSKVLFRDAVRPPTAMKAEDIVSDNNNNNNVVDDDVQLKSDDLDYSSNTSGDYAYDDDDYSPSYDGGNYIYEDESLYPDSQF